MPDERTLFERLLSAQNRIGVIVKDKKNPFYNSTYADINDILKEVLPILNDEGIVLLQPLTHIDGKPAMKTILMCGNEKMEFETVFPDPSKPAEGKQFNPYQDKGKGTTYIRRISLQSLFGLRAEDDDGDAMTQTAPKKEAQQKEQPNAQSSQAGSAKEIPTCSICHQPMKPQKTNPDKFFCKHEKDGKVQWGVPVWKDQTKVS